MVRVKLFGGGVQLMGFHKYEGIWVPKVGETLPCKYIRDKGIVAYKDGLEVGSVKAEVAKLSGLKMLLENGGTLEAIIQNSVPKISKKKGKSLVVNYVCSVQPNTNLTEETIRNTLNGIRDQIKTMRGVKIIFLSNNLPSTPQVPVNRGPTNETKIVNGKRKNHDDDLESDVRKKPRQDLRSQILPSTSKESADRETANDTKIVNGKRKNHDNDLESDVRKKPCQDLCSQIGPPLQAPHILFTEKITSRLCQCISGSWEIFFVELGLKRVKIQQIQKEHKGESESALIFQALEVLGDLRSERGGYYLDDFLNSAWESPALVDVNWILIERKLPQYFKT